MCLGITPSMGLHKANDWYIKTKAQTERRPTYVSAMLVTSSQASLLLCVFTSLLCVRLQSLSASLPVGSIDTSILRPLARQGPGKGRLYAGLRSGAGLMEAGDRKVTTLFTVQPSFHHRHSTNAASWSFTIFAERRGELCLHVRRR